MSSRQVLRIQAYEKYVKGERNEQGSYDFNDSYSCNDL